MIRLVSTLLLMVVASSISLYGQAMVEYSILSGSSGSAGSAIQGAGRSISGVFERLNQIQSGSVGSDSVSTWTPPTPRRPLSLAGRDLLELSPRDAKVLMGIRIWQLLDSPIGLAVERKLRESSPEFQQWLQQNEASPLSLIEEIVIASRGGGKNPPALLLVRCDCNDQVREMVARSEGVESAEISGTTVFKGPPRSDSPVQGLVFLDSTTAVAGDLESLENYLLHPPTAGAPGALQAQAHKARNSYDFWIVADSPADSLAADSPQTASASPNPWASIKGFSGGIRFGTDIDVTAELAATDVESARQLGAAISTFGALFTSNTTSSNQEELARLVDAVQLVQEGRTIRLSLRVPESEVAAAFDRRPQGGDVQIYGGNSRRGARPEDEVLTIQASPRDGGTRVIRLKDVNAP